MSQVSNQIDKIAKIDQISKVNHLLIIPATIIFILLLFLWITFIIGTFKLKRILFNKLPKLKLLRINFFINVTILLFSIIIFIIFLVFIITYELKMKEKEV